jgi:hypothetical protein
MKEKYETMVDNIEKTPYLQEIFQVTYYDVYSVEESF